MLPNVGVAVVLVVAEVILISKVLILIALLLCIVVSKELTAHNREDGQSPSTASVESRNKQCCPNIVLVMVVQITALVVVVVPAD